MDITVYTACQHEPGVTRVWTSCCADLLGVLLEWKASMEQQLKVCWTTHACSTVVGRKFVTYIHVVVHSTDYWLGARVPQKRHCSWLSTTRTRKPLRTLDRTNLYAPPWYLVTAALIPVQDAGKCRRRYERSGYPSLQVHPECIDSNATTCLWVWPLKLYANDGRSALYKAAQLGSWRVAHTLAKNYKTNFEYGKLSNTKWHCSVCFWMTDWHHLICF